MKKVLVTGFEPFGGDISNPSHELLKFLNLQSFSFEVKTQLLPVSFTTALPRLDQVISDFLPTHVLLTGYAVKREELSIERIGINWVDARIPDNEGLTLKAQKILESGPDGLFTTIPLEAMVSAVKNTVPLKISTSAGEYVCNHVLYSVLTRYPNIKATFIHIPKAQSYSDYFRALQGIIEAL